MSEKTEPNSTDDTGIVRPAPHTTHSESRRIALIRRQQKLIQELDVIARELMTYPIEVTDAEISQTLEVLDTQKTRLHISGDTDDMENVLALYNVDTESMSAMDASLDAILIRTMKTLIDSGKYVADKDLSEYDGDVALRLKIGDEFHGRSLLDGVVSISSLAQSANGVGYVAKVNGGELVVPDSDKELESEIKAKLTHMIDQSEYNIETLDGYYLFVINGDAFDAYEVPVKVTENKPEEVKAPKLKITTSPSDSYLAKIGPMGRIRFQHNTSRIITLSKDRDEDPQQVLSEISRIAMERANMDDFIYVSFSN